MFDHAETLMVLEGGRNLGNPGNQALGDKGVHHKNSHHLSRVLPRDYGHQPPNQVPLAYGLDLGSFLPKLRFAKALGFKGGKTRGRNIRPAYPKRFTQIIRNHLHRFEVVFRPFGLQKFLD
jgi:hypothetical protein